jgi:hypothetical protein
MACDVLGALFILLFMHMMSP